MNNDIQAHCREIERCNQRGGRMLSVVDLLEAGTLTRPVAAYALAALRGGASFLVGALPGGAGKTTVMGALLNFVPAGLPLAPADGPAAIADGRDVGARPRCYICHEIGAGDYYAYLWGELLRRYFELPRFGHTLATNLHADTYEQARAQVCDENGVPAACFRGVHLLFFLAVRRDGLGVTRRVASVWESDGDAEHRPVFDSREPCDLPRRSRRVDARAFADADGELDRLLASGARTIQDVRTRLVGARGSPVEG